MPVCALFFSTLPLARADVDVAVGEDLQADGALAERHELPILLAFTAIDCGYCAELEEEFLQPMLLGGEYEDRVIVRKIVLDNGSRLTGFDGRRQDATALSDAYRVFVTPTLLFVDNRGEERAGRMLGFNTPELYGGYLDDCIETALKRIRTPGSDDLPASCLDGRQR